MLGKIIGITDSIVSVRLDINIYDYDNLISKNVVFRDNNIIYDPIKLNKLATNIAVFFSVENISDIYSYSLYSSKISQKKEFAYRFLRFLEEKYGFVCENYSVFERNDFISIYSVYKFLKERYKW